MYLPSLTTALSVAFLAYMGHSMWSIAQLFLHPSCDPSKVGMAPSTTKEGRDLPVFCLESALWAKGSVWTKSTGSEPMSPRLRIVFVTSTSGKRIADSSGFDYVGYLDILDIEETIEQNFKVSLTESARKNGTMHILSFTVPYRKDENPDVDWSKMISSQDVTNAMMPLTVHHVPEAKTFNLLGEEANTLDKDKKTDNAKSDKISDKKPVTHIRSKITVSVMADAVAMASNEIPPELYYFIKLKPATNSKGSTKHEYLPISYLDELSLRLRDLVIVNKTDKTAEVAITYRPISYGKMRMFLQFTTALASMHSLGFTAKDTDEVKGIFADTNMMLLLITFGVSTVHLLFDFLAFKNEINFWRKKKSMVGLSTRTVLWRAFSQAIVFLYLMDEDTSLLVLIPSGIASLIELWKVTKAFKVHIEFRGSFVPKVSLGSATEGEKTTEAFDSKSMRYLSYVLYPLCLGGAVYSLVYTPHKSWYSWTIQTMVNGVYAFGFLFMLPQLFVNYKLKSVAHLPWRAFMYKAFNTFIDDLFAFIITMPTAHRVACFRDDVVFLVYLYQRYLYPVDKSRLDIGAAMTDEDGEVVLSEKEEKKTQ